MSDEVGGVRQAGLRSGDRSACTDELRGRVGRGHRGELVDHHRCRRRAGAEHGGQHERDGQCGGVAGAALGEHVQHGVVRGRLIEGDRECSGAVGGGGAEHGRCAVGGRLVQRHLAANHGGAVGLDRAAETCGGRWPHRRHHDCQHRCGSDAQRRCESSESPHRPSSALTRTLLLAACARRNCVVTLVSDTVLHLACNRVSDTTVTGPDHGYDPRHE